MSTVVVRPRALADLAEIWAYISDDSPGRADAFVDLVDSKFQALSRRPGVGRRRPELSSDIRSLTVGRYVAVLPAPFSWDRSRSRASRLA